MRKAKTLVLIFLFVIVSAYGKESVLYHKMQQAKSSDIHFENAVLKVTSPDIGVLKHFEIPEDVFFFDNISIDLKEKSIRAINLSLPMRDRNMILELMEVDDDFYNYYVETSDGQVYSANRDIRHYRGIVQNERNSIVAITFYEDEIIGIVCTDEGNFNISKSRQSGKHLFFNSNNLMEKMDFVCGTEDDTSIEYPPDVLFQERNNLSKQKYQETLQATVRKLKFYVETEYDIYQNKGYSYQNVEAYISGLFNQVGILYENESILTRVSYMYIWTSNDPYTGTNTETLLDEFYTKRTEILGDLSILLTFRSVGGGRAKVDQLCGYCWSFTTCNKPSVAGIYSYYDIFTDYAWSTECITHELGHSIGSKHTHACVWNGNNTAIDGCYDVEGSCSKPGIPQNGGTIMSYCHLQSVGIKFVNGFGEQPGNLIRNKINNADCLECESVIYINNVLYGNAVYDKWISIRINGTATIKSGSSMELEACPGGTITINGNFTIKEGAEFIIKE